VHELYLHEVADLCLAEFLNHNCEKLKDLVRFNVFGKR
jgi:hypothetical protein